jgi:DNA replication licensing factor MCM7
VNALSDMNIEEDDLSDEYDFMDDEDEGGENARRQARLNAKQPKLKYMELLQKVADRNEDEITIDLDDLAKVDILIVSTASQSR